MLEVGNVCYCNQGRLGVVTKIVKNSHGSVDFPDKYVGIGFDGQPWESIKAEKVADNVADYILRFVLHGVIEKRL